MDDSTPALTEHQRRDLACVLDAVLPASADGRMPAAGQAGVAAYIERSLAQAPEMRPLLEEGLRAAAEISRRHGVESLDRLAAETRRQALEELQATASGMFSALTFPTCMGYYQMPAVLEALGVGAHPPHPGGYDMEPNDLSLLDPVRRRGRLYRDA